MNDSGITISAPSSVEAIVLFGSRARGDADASSDTDLAVFANAESPQDLIAVKREMSEEMRDASLSVYSLRTAERMAEEGSLFLWHVRLEGRVLFVRSDWLDRTMSRLQAYSGRKAKHGLSTICVVLDDIVQSVNNSDTTMLFEVSTLFTLLRTLGMIVGMYSGSPSFSRFGPIEHLQSEMAAAFPLSTDDLSHLINAKLLYSQRKDGDIGFDRRWCLATAHRIQNIAAYAAARIHATTH